MSVKDYKTIFDVNDYKKNSYEVALFISFLMNKKIGNKEIEELTGLKKSQVFSYKKVIKHNKVEELRTTPFRKVLKSCTDASGPKVEREVVNAIENLVLEQSPPKSKYEAPHVYNEWELSPGRSTRYHHDYCPCDLPTGPSGRGQNFVHIPEFEFSGSTFLRLEEITGYVRQINYLKRRVEKLEMENTALRVHSVKRTSV